MALGGVCVSRPEYVPEAEDPGPTPLAPTQAPTALAAVAAAVTRIGMPGGGGARSALPDAVIERLCLLRGTQPYHADSPGPGGGLTASRMRARLQPRHNLTASRNRAGHMQYGRYHASHPGAPGRPAGGRTDGVTHVGEAAAPAPSDGVTRRAGDKK